MRKSFKKISFYLIMLLPFLAAACGNNDGDDGGGSASNPTNTNANTGSAELLRKEVPAINSGSEDGNIYNMLVRTTDEGINYIIKWNQTKKAQCWTAYIHTSATKKVVWNRNKWTAADNYWSNYNSTHSGTTDPFQPDPDLGDNGPQLTDYSGSGYTRGHICAQAERMYSKEANRQTFYLTNMHPQLYGFNSGIWLQMENKVQTTSIAKSEWNSDAFRDTLWVCKGGTIRDGEIMAYTHNNSSSGLPVPKYFFMAVVKVKDGVYSGMAFYVPHDASIATTSDDTDVKKYAMTIRALEQKTGIDFFCNFPDKLENAIETNYQESVWFK